MKRHESLAPLSREHHGALILAQLIKRNAPVYKNLPTTIVDKVEYSIHFFNNELKGHFKKEELLLHEVKEIHPSIATIADEILAEHILLKGLFRSLKDAYDPEAVLNELGNELDARHRCQTLLTSPHTR